MRGVVGLRHAAGILLVLALGWGWVWVFDRPAQAASSGFLAGALACPAGVEASACTRETALDVLTQPVALVTECPMVGVLLATHLSLPAGGTHKTFCERRRS